MKIVTLCDDSEESISFSLMNMMPASVCIFIFGVLFSTQLVIKGHTQALDGKKRRDEA